MTRQEKLEWLARNCHEWPDASCGYIKVAEIKGTIYQSWPRYSDDEMFTHQEWLSMREKLQNKPSWKDAPEWANWLGQCASGSWEWYEGSEEPVPDEVRGCFKHTKRGIWSRNRGEALGDWRNTLEKRPEMTSKNNDVRDYEDVPPCKTQDNTWSWSAGWVSYPLIEINNHSSSTVTATKTGQSEMTITTQDNSWHERGELPPVGDVVEAWFDDGRECWHMADVVGYNKHENGVIAVSLIGKHERKLVWVHHFRPLRTEREKAIDEMKQYCAYPGSWFNTYKPFAEALYDAGLIKEQTK